MRLAVLLLSLLVGCAPPPRPTRTLPPARPQLPAYDYAEAERKPLLLGSWRGVDDNARYPEMARRAQITGTVTVRFVVTAEGEPVEVRIIRGIGGGCDEATIEAIRDERFRPGRLNDEPVNVRLEATATFTLPEAAITFAPVE